MHASRLQAKLKKPDRERLVPKQKNTRNTSLNSVNNSQGITYQLKISASSASGGSNKRRSPRSAAWAKPKALLDASISQERSPSISGKCST